MIEGSTKSLTIEAAGIHENDTDAWANLRDYYLLKARQAHAKIKQIKKEEAWLLKKYSGARVWKRKLSKGLKMRLQYMKERGLIK